MHLLAMKSFFIFSLVCLSFVDASMSTIRIKDGEKFVYEDAAGASGIQRDVPMGHQILLFNDTSKFVKNNGGMCADDYEILPNKTFIIHKIDKIDAGYYQPYPNGIIWNERGEGKLGPTTKVEVY
ncbi:unnamed protein product [Caenorhabditis bovis]|uniref:Uncharacterized protein n=1 Tax=Caenorhabditis bovis TaxID=2654633 RepID=A0A8S1EXB1_9PELO|nr:unnamed protein product [Caenorhabditis bovis]